MKKRRVIGAIRTAVKGIGTRFFLGFAVRRRQIFEFSGTLVPVLFLLSSFFLFLHQMAGAYLGAEPEVRSASTVNSMVNLAYSITRDPRAYNIPYHINGEIPVLLSLFYIILPAVLVVRELTVSKRRAFLMFLSVLLLVDFSGVPFYSAARAYLLMLPVFAFGVLSRSELVNRIALSLISGIKKIKPNQLLLFILLVAFLLRFFYILDDSSLRSLSEGNEAYAAYRIFNGQLPYRDFIYTHLPLTPLLIALFYKVFGAGLFQAKLLNLFVNVLSTIPLYWLGNRFYGRGVAALAAFFWAVHPNSLMAGSFVLLDSFMVLFLLVATMLFFQRQSLFLAGMLLGIATLSKESAAMALVPFFIYLLSNRQPTKVLYLSAGFAIPLLSIVYFYALGPDNFLFIPSFHLSIFKHTLAQKFSTFFDELYLGRIAFLFVFVVGFTATLRKRTADSLFLLSWFLSLFLLFFNRVFWWKYALNFLPVFLVLLSYGVLELLGPWWKAARPNLGLGCCFFVLLLLFVGAKDVGFIMGANDDGKKVSEVLKGVTNGGDYVISPMLQIPLLAGRDVPGVFQEFGVQNALLGSDQAIRLLEEYNVSAVVMDSRILSAGHLGGFREFVFSNFKEVPVPDIAEKDLSVWIRIKKGG